MKNRWMFYGAVVLTLAGLLAFPPQVRGQTGTVVRVDPPRVELAPGETVEIVVLIENAVNLRGFDIELQFDPERFTAGALAAGDLIPSGLHAPTNGIDNLSGQIEFGIAIVGDDVRSGSESLFSFQLTAKGDFVESLLIIRKAELVGEDFLLAPYMLEDGLGLRGTVDDDYQVLPGTWLDVPAPGVLTNDVLPDGFVFLAQLVEPFSGPGVLDWPKSNDGSFIYHPPGDWAGMVTFYYQVCSEDNQTCFGPAAVRILIERPKPGYEVFLPLVIAP